MIIVMFDQHLKITLRKSSVPSEKVRFPFFTHPPPNYSNIENFSALSPPCRKGGRGGEDIESTHSHLSHPSPLLHKTYPFQLLIYLPMDNSKILPPKLHS